jgi:hypothetical protein
MAYRLPCQNFNKGAQAAPFLFVQMFVQGTVQLPLSTAMGQGEGRAKKEGRERPSD